MSNNGVNYRPFSVKEDCVLWHGHEQLGRRWDDISTRFFENTRSGNQLRSRFFCRAFKRRVASATRQFDPEPFRGIIVTREELEVQDATDRDDSPPKSAPRDQDDLQLWLGHKELGKDWLIISTKYFNGHRSKDAIEARWHSVPFQTFVVDRFGSDAYHDAIDSSNLMRMMSPYAN